MSRQVTLQELDFFEGNGGTGHAYGMPFDTAHQTQVTYGDGHGNALLITDILRLNHFLEISEDDYKDLAQIYFLTAKKYAPRLAKYGIDRDGLPYKLPDAPGKPRVALTSKELRKYNSRLKKYDQALHDFTAIIDRCKVKSNIDRKRLFRSLGDNFSDRGGNDLFTLSLFFKLYPSDVSVEALLGNHDQAFLYHWATNFKNRTHTSIKEEQSRSYSNLFDLIKHGLVSKSAVDNLIQNYYLPTLRLISYSTSDEPRSLSIFTHAPVKDPLLIVQLLAKHYFPEFSEKAPEVDTREKVTSLIDRINAEFQKRILGEGGKAEFIKIQEEFINRKLENLNKFREEESYTKKDIEDKHTHYYQEISNILSNHQKLAVPISIKQLQALFTEILKIDYSKEENRTGRNFWRAISQIASKFPKHIFTKLKIDFDEKTKGVEEIDVLESEAAKIFSNIPVAFGLMLKYKPGASKFDLKNISAYFPEIEQGVKEENADDEELLSILGGVKTQLNSFRDYEFTLQKKIHELNYEHAPFAALLWEHFEERPDAECPKTLKGDGTLVYSGHGHDSKKPEDNIKHEENRFDLNSRLGLAANLTIQEEAEAEAAANTKEEADAHSKKCLAAFNHSTKSEYTGFGQEWEIIGPAKAYINSDQHPKEPEIVSQHREKLKNKEAIKKLEDYRQLSEEYVEVLHGIQHYQPKNKEKTLKAIEFVVTTANEILRYQGNQVQAPQLEAAPSPTNQEPVTQTQQTPTQSDQAPSSAAAALLKVPTQEEILSAQEYSELPTFKKHVAARSLITPLTDPNLTAAQQAKTFEENFSKAQTQLAAPRDFLPQHRKFAIFLGVCLAIITGGLVAIGILVYLIHLKITRNSYDVFRSNGAFFGDKIKAVENRCSLESTLFSPTPK